MANEKNLKPFTSDQDREEAARNGRKGGKARAESIKRKKDIRLALEILLESDVKGKDGKKMSGAEAMAAKVFQGALKGDWKAWELVRDTAGQKAPDKLITSEVDPKVIAEVEAIISKGEAEGKDGDTKRSS